MRHAIGLIGVAVLAGATGTSWAQLIAYEGFDMSNNGVGTIVGTKGTGGGTATWQASNWTSSGGHFFRTDAGLSYGNLTVTGGKATARIQTPESQGNDQLFRVFGPQPGTGTYWISAIIDIVKNDVSSSFGYSLFNGGAEMNFVGKPGGNFWGSVDNSDFFGEPFFKRFEATGIGNAGVIVNFDSVLVTPKALVLSKYDMTLKKAWHWVNPDISNGEPSVETSWTTADGITLFSGFAFDRVRLGQFDGQPESSIDEFRLGRTFVDVAPITIPPTAVAGDFGGAESPDGSFNTPDDDFNELDVEGFLLALNDQASYLALNPTLGDSLVDRGDFGGAESTDGSFNTPDGGFNELDVEGFLLALNDPAGYAAIQPASRVSAIPEPAAMAVLAPLGLLLSRRRR